MITNAVPCASVLYNIPQDTSEEDKELLRCIELLWFSPPEADRTVYSDGDCNVIFNEENMVDLEDFDENGAGYIQSPIGNPTIFNANKENMADEDDDDDNGPGYFHDGIFSIIMIIIPSLSLLVVI